MNRKTGAPINEVIMPIGISWLVKILRDSVSTNSINMLPLKSIIGKILLLEVLQAIRTAWGTMSPKKPIMPHCETITPVRKVTVRMYTFLFFLTLTPRLVAASSPKLIKLRDRYCVKKKIMAPSVDMATKSTWIQEILERLPIVQKVMFLILSASLAKYIIKLVKAIHNELAMTPDKMILSVVGLPL